MREKKILLFAILYIWLASCGNNHDNFRNGYDISHSGRKNLKLKNFSIDSITLDPVETSFDGKLFVENGLLSFVDRRFGWIYQFSPSGHFLKRFSVRISGLNDIKSHYIQFYSPLPNGQKFILGSKNDCYIFSPDFKLAKSFMLEWWFTQSKSESFYHFKPSDPGLYMPLYEIGPPAALDESHIYLPIASQHPIFNQSAKPFYQNAAIAVNINLSDENIQEVVGAYPKSIVNNKYSWLLSFPSITASKQNYYLTFGTDSLIYKLDKDFTIKEKFGFKGKSVSDTFRVAKNIYDIRPQWKKDARAKGYNKALFYDKDNDLLFRTYTADAKKGGLHTGGMQVYNDTNLIAEFSVPRDFTIKGYVKPYYYSEAVIDDINGKIKVYRIKLN